MIQMKLQNRESENGCQEEELEEGIVREFGVDMCTLLYLK